MHFQHAHLDECDQSALVAEIEISARLLKARNLELTDLRRNSRSRMALKKTFLRSPHGAPYEANRPVPHLRQYPVGNGFVISRKCALGDALLGIKHFVRMRQANTGNGQLFAHGASTSWINLDGRGSR